MRQSVAVLSTGSEITDGRVHERNGHYAARRCAECGIALQHLLVCDDRPESIAASLDFLLGSADFLIVSGGIGPTSDDLTREAVSAYTGSELALDEQVLAEMKEKYAARRRDFDPSNNKQALMPRGAVQIPNPQGTAAGFRLRCGACDGAPRCIFVLPGVPFEFEEMFEQSVLPFILNEAGDRRQLRTSGFRVFGVPESVIGSRVAGCGLPREIVVSYRAAFPEVHVLLKTEAPAIPLNELCSSAIQAVGNEFVVSRDVQAGLERVVHGLLCARSMTISVAESCTAGMVGALLTRHAGSSRFFVGGELAYANEVKEQRLGVARETLQQCGAVSYETASEMAAGARRCFGTDVALSITGISGPDGEVAGKPVGTFYVGFADAARIASYRFFFASERGRAREYEAFTALDVLRRHLLGLPIREHNPQCNA